MQVAYKQFTSYRSFGVELETSRTISQENIQKIISEADPFREAVIVNWSSSKGNKKWHIKTDASCGGAHDDFGWEIASYKASGIHDIISIGDMAERLHNYGLRINPDCGLHVHAEVKDFSEEDMGCFLSRWIAVEPWLYNAVPWRRAASGYCKALRHVHPPAKNEYSAIDLWHHFLPEIKNYNGNDCRRVALNLTNYYNELPKKRRIRCTIELRLPEGTLRGIEVKNWVRFFIHMVDTSKRSGVMVPLEAKTLDEMFDAVGLGHGDGFSILSPGLRETKLWLLKRLKKWHFNRSTEAIEEYIRRMTWPEKLAL